MSNPLPSRREAFAVIMAGGRGERFWPQSRLSHPKQLLRLLGNLTLIEQTVERLSSIFPPDHIVVITNGDYVAPMRSLMSQIPEQNIIGEPMGKDTAPCIAFAAAYVRSIAKDVNPVLCVLPADHIITNAEAFARNISDCMEEAVRTPSIVTIGIPPTSPSTGYGYIERGDPIATESQTVFHSVLGFKEKPDIQLAGEYVSSGRYQWNSGIFVMALSTILAAFDAYAPDLKTFSDDVFRAFTGQSDRSIDELYSRVRKISIDYAVMEHEKNILIATSAFDWDDVGSWTSMRNQIRPEAHNNVVRGLHVGIDTSDCIIVGNAKHLIATVDVQDMVIVHTEDATLVCNGKSAQRIKELVQLISSKPELSSFL